MRVKDFLFFERERRVMFVENLIQLEGLASRDGDEHFIIYHLGPRSHFSDVCQALRLLKHLVEIHATVLVDEHSTGNFILLTRLSVGVEDAGMREDKKRLGNVVDVTGDQMNLRQRGLRLMVLGEVLG